jgi:hypothetical protein
MTMRRELAETSNQSAKELSMLDQSDKLHERGAAPEEQPAEGKTANGHAAAAALSDYVRHAADYTRELADKLQGQKADELVASALTWTRKQPLLLIGGAFVLGFVLSRLAMGGAARDDRPTEASER